MTRRLAAAIGALGALGAIYLALAFAPAAVAAPYGATSTAPICMEDRPCWRWRTMGNHRRGVWTIGGRHLVVGPAGFDRLNRAFRIDWTRSVKLRGDGTRHDAQLY